MLSLLLCARVSRGSKLTAGQQLESRDPLKPGSGRFISGDLIEPISAVERARECPSLSKAARCGRVSLWLHSRRSESARKRGAYAVFREVEASRRRKKSATCDMNGRGAERLKCACYLCVSVSAPLFFHFYHFRLFVSLFARVACFYQILYKTSISPAGPGPGQTRLKGCNLGRFFFSEKHCLF